MRAPGEHVRGEAPILEQLRAATRAHHEQVERPFASLLSASPQRSDYLGFIAAMSVFHEALEPALGAAVGWDSLVPHCVAPGGRVRALAADCAVLGVSVPAITCRVPILPSFSAALGAAYVVEGSALGGRVLLRNLAPRLGISAERGACFLAADGEDTVARFRSLVTALTNHVRGGGESAEVVAGALEAFACLIEVLQQLSLRNGHAASASQP